MSQPSGSDDDSSCDAAAMAANREVRAETMQRGTRTGDVAEVGLREMVVHLNVIDASIELVGNASGADVGPAARDFLGRLDTLAFAAARLQIAEIPRVTDALEELVLTSRRPHQDDEFVATLRHGVDVLMLLTHDKMRRMQGHPAAELRPATDALLERVGRLIGRRPPNAPPALKVAGL